MASWARDRRMGQGDMHGLWSHGCEMLRLLGKRLSLSPAPHRLPPSSHPPLPLLAHSFTFSQVPISSGSSRPTSQRVIREKSSYILCFSAVVTNGKVITFLTSEFLNSVPAKIMREKIFYFLYLLIRYGRCWPVEGRWALAELLLITVHSKSEGRDLEYEKNIKTFTATIKPKRNTQRGLCKHSFSLLFQHQLACQFSGILKCK